MPHLPGAATAAGTQCHVLGSREPFAESILWQLQARYFVKRGIEAWQRAEVPFYVTSNPVIANAYAQVVWAFRQDRRRLSGSDHDATEQPVTICELGAGAGAFAFFFIRRMIELCRQAGVAPATVFRYVLTDMADANLAAWGRHPCFSEWIASGLLDIAHFDITQDHALTLQVSGEILAPAGLSEPLVVIANYLFDSIPQDLLYLHAGRSRRCLLSLTLDDDPAQINEAEQMARAHYRYDYAPLSDPPYQDPALVALCTHYAAELEDTHVLVPELAWRGMQRLDRLAQGGMLLLGADKGGATLDALDRQGVPHIQSHGSVSLPANIHALRWLTEHDGGLSLAAADPQREFTVFALLRMPHAAQHHATRMAFAHHIDEARSGDFYLLSRLAQKAAHQMEVGDMVAYARLSRYDSEQFKFFLPRLMAVAPSLAAYEKAAILEVIEKVWAAYFPLGEELDLAYHLGCILYEMGNYQEALHYFYRSQDIYGSHTGTLFNMAVCHRMMGSLEQAVSLLRQVLRVDITNEPARELLQELSS